MEVISDANIIFAALINVQGITRRVLFLERLKVFAPEYLKQEVEEHKEEALQKSGISKQDFDIALELIFSQVNFVPYSEFVAFLQKAKDVCPDPNDVEYIALALKLECSLWSNDKKLKEQSLVTVLSTSELSQLLL